MDMWNRQRESKNTKLYKIGSGTKLYYLWVRGFQHEERERDTHNHIISSQPNQRAAPVVHKFIWPRPALNVDSLIRRQELNSLLFLKSQNPQPMLPGMTSFISLVPLSIWEFYFDICEWCFPRARINTCVNVAPN